MNSVIRLFKAVEIKSKKKKEPSKAILKETVKRGFIFSPEVIGNYSETGLNNLIKAIEKEIGLTAEQMNSSFHKSWKKIKEASMEQLFFEQITHYFTTYGFESLGIYDKDSVYIPNERLDLPNLKEGITLVVIKGYTKGELKEKLLSLLQSGIALSEDTIKDIVDIAVYVGIEEKDIDHTRNKEVKIELYDHFGLVPENPIEFLRYVVYTATDKTLLIKNKATIEAIKSRKNPGVLQLFVRYKKRFGLEKLAQIFNRFKPIFLAFRTNARMRSITNRINKLAKKHHKPMQEDYLNTVTAKIKRGDKIEERRLKEELGKANIFRKIRLAYALKFRTRDVDSIIYRVRNGKGYATEFSFDRKNIAKKIFDVVAESIIDDLKANVKGKKIYIPENIIYALPATEKQFTGDFPSGTCIIIPKDAVVGIHWENAGHNRVDLDLSMVNANRKMGWDSLYRSEDGKILFSGDVTDAPAPKGASELFYVKRQEKDAHVLFVNYYNQKHDSKIAVPIEIITAKEEVKNLSRNYVVNPNNVIAIAKTKINQKQKILGLLVTTTDECRIYFAETHIGNSITSPTSETSENSRKFLFDFYGNTISLNEMLVKAGGKIVRNKDDCDIDLSPQSLEKDKIISLIRPHG